VKRKITWLLAAILLVGALTACSNDAGVTAISQPIMLEEAVATYSFGIAFQRGNTVLRDQVWAALQVLSADGTVAQIARQWFGYDPTKIPPDPDATTALEEVRARTLIIGFDPNMAPMSFIDESGAQAGFDIALAQAVADYYGWTLELHPIRWSDREMELASGNIDSLWGGVSLTEHITERLDHTEPYMENRQVVVTMSGAGIQNHRGLRGRTLAALAGSVSELALAENTSFQSGLGEINLRTSLYTALRDMEQGLVDAVLMDQVAAVHYIRTGDILAFGGREVAHSIEPAYE